MRQLADQAINSPTFFHIFSTIDLGKIGILIAFCYADHSLNSLDIIIEFATKR